jgi:ABC-type sugar transport system substrate-binding protein
MQMHAEIEEALFMFRRRKRVFGIAAVAVIAGAATLTALTTTASGSRSGPKADKPKVALITLYREPLAQQMNAGAQLAAREYGADYHWQGPPGLNPPQEVKMLQDEVAAGTKGIVLMQYPPDLFNAPIRQATDQGVSVITIDVSAPDSTSGTHVGPAKTELGIAEGLYLGKLLGKSAKGYIVPGICVPGLDVLVAPFVGVRKILKVMSPGVVVRKELNVTGDPATNFTAWQRIISQNPKALGFIGNCDQDAPNLVKIKQQKRGKFLIADTSGDGIPVLRAVKAGTMNVVIGQAGFVSGYVAMKLVLEKLVNKKEPPKGWLDSGIETITRANVDAAIRVRQQLAAGNLRAGYTYYRRAILRALAQKPKLENTANTQANLRPLVTP